MESIKKYIQIELRGTSPTGKTQRWRVHNFEHNTVIGWIKWYGAFKKYVFYAETQDMDWVLFDSDCLRMIADFLDNVNKVHRAQKKSVQSE